MLTEALNERILVLDGGFGTMLQTYDLGDAVTASPNKAGGCNDLLSVTRPDIVADIHRRYLDAGADIIETNSFNANAISLADYNLQQRTYEIALAAAKLARKVADEYSTPEKPRYVAGSVGPTNRTLSMSADVNSPGSREVTFDEMREAYLPQIQALIDGGVDVIMVETVFDTLNAKAALAALRQISPDFPVIVSATISDASGRILSGQTIEAFCASVMHARPIALGLNCGLGAKSLLPYLRRLAEVAPVRISVHPNAGLPNIYGQYDETPATMAADIKEMLSEGLLNIVGGCCGTTPEHIRAIAIEAATHTPRHLPDQNNICTVSGLETLTVTPESNFINVGERTNVAGSAKFARLIREGNYQEALSIARAQVQAGAQIIDVCMDAALIDAPSAMSRFLCLIASEPEIARVPVMIDSSDFNAIEAGLKCTQGKSIVNSISLKEGEAAFISKAKKIMAYGAAAVVMLFDENGQADTFKRKIQVAQRAYNLLCGIGFPPQDIIFDPNILAVATGMPEHDCYALDFIEATRWIKQHLPFVKVSGGVSNLSFAFRGNNTVRSAMHSVFLYHCIRAGMDMAIVNPQMTQIYDDIQPELLQRIEDLILYRRKDAADRLIAMANTLTATAQTPDAATTADQWRSLPVGDRIKHAMLKGDDGYIAEDTLEAYRLTGDAVKVVSDVLMPAMTNVGDLFGQGKLFLPQVVKSARVMKLAVASIEPYFNKAAADGLSADKRVVLATVKGDVHDIGKNIVGVVLSCNGWQVIDLGVMVDASRIIDEAVANDAKAICLSGLITPSLNEMMQVAREAQRRGIDIPIVVGGATTSDQHTAIMIAPLYDGPVTHSTDAAHNATILSHLTADDAAEYVALLRQRQAALRAAHQAHTSTPVYTTKSARIATCPCCCTSSDYVVTRSIADVEPLINWSFFFAAWGLPGKYPDILSHPVKGVEATKLMRDAQAMLERMKADESISLRGVVREFHSHVDGDDIVLSIDHNCDNASDTSQTYRLPMPKITDMVGDSVKLFAISGAFGLDMLTRQYREANDEYSAMMAKFICDRLTEAFAEAILPDGHRLAIGYPLIPDHSLKRDVFALLDAERLTGMSLTESCMIIPGESICGIWL